MATGMEKNNAMKNVAAIRALRVVRIVRMARIIRVLKFFRELRIMIYSIIGCLKNLAWVLLVLGMTFYIFGVAFTSAITDALDTPEKWHHEQHETLRNSFGTLERAVLSLFMSMSGGNDWALYYESLVYLPAGYPVAYIFFIGFTMFAVVNIVTGVFVEAALQNNIRDKDIVVADELETKKVYLRSMQEVFMEMDEDGYGTISREEFEKNLACEKIIAYFNALKLDVSDAKVLFTLLDYDHTGEITIDEFLDGCYKLQGESRSLDMKIMQYEVKFIERSVIDMNEVMIRYEKVMQRCVDHMDAASRGLSRINVTSPGPPLVPVPRNPNRPGSRPGTSGSFGQWMEDEDV